MMGVQDRDWYHEAREKRERPLLALPDRWKTRPLGWWKSLAWWNTTPGLVLASVLFFLAAVAAVHAWDSRRLTPAGDPQNPHRVRADAECHLLYTGRPRLSKTEAQAACAVMQDQAALLMKADIERPNPGAIGRRMSEQDVDRDKPLGAFIGLFGGAVATLSPYFIAPMMTRPFVVNYLDRREVVYPVGPGWGFGSHDELEVIFPLSFWNGVVRDKGPIEMTRLEDGSVFVGGCCHGGFVVQRDNAISTQFHVSEINVPDRYRPLSEIACRYPPGVGEPCRGRPPFQGPTAPLFHSDGSPGIPASPDWKPG